MKHFTFLAFCTSLLFPFVALAEDELEDQNLEDYLIQEEGTKWGYMVVTENLVEGTTANDTLNIEAQECDLKETCFTWLVSDEERNYLINSEGTTATLEGGIYFTTETFEDEYEVDGYDSYTLSCTSEILEDYTVLFFDNTSIKMTCEINTITSEDNTAISYISSTTLMKGVGLVAYDTYSYVGELLTGFTEMELAFTTINPESPFSDVSESHKNFDAISYLFQEGVFAGYEDGTFKPDQTVNRAELLKILVEGQGITPDETTYANCFSDVGTDWYAKYVCYAKEQGWVEGYEGGVFKPSNTVNKVEALKMLLNSQGVNSEIPKEAPFSDVSLTDWFAPYVETAKNLGILEETASLFEPSNDKDREGIAENLYRLLLSLQLDDVSMALSESTCLIADPDAGEDLLNDISDLMTEYGFDNPYEIDYYIQNISELILYDVLTTQISIDLEATCGDMLEEQGLDISEYVDLILEVTE